MSKLPGKRRGPSQVPSRWRHAAQALLVFAGFQAATLGALVALAPSVPEVRRRGEGQEFLHTVTSDRFHALEHHIRKQPAQSS